MIGLLSLTEIDELLARNQVGRLACTANDRPYIVPINYAYDGVAIYGFSTVGRKNNVMREQPLVCFEVDEITGPTMCRSVVIEVVYEELIAEHQKRNALSRLNQRHALSGVPRSLDASGALVIFRIRPIASSGRFEVQDA